MTVALHVDDRGRVTNARVVKGLGDGLDQNALVAGRQWRSGPERATAARLRWMPRSTSSST